MSDKVDKEICDDTSTNPKEVNDSVEKEADDDSLINDNEGGFEKETSEGANGEKNMDGDEVNEDSMGSSNESDTAKDTSQSSQLTDVSAISQPSAAENDDGMDEDEDDEDQEPDVEGDLTSFLEWCSSNGLTLSPKVKVTNEGTIHRYGLVAAEEIKKGETLFRVPREICLHSDNGSMAERLEDYELWLDEEDKSLEETSGWIPLLITLLYEFNKKDSMWAPYMRLVPTEDTFGHPMFWSEEERNTELRGINVLWEVKRDIKNIEEEYYNYVVPFLQRNKSVFGKLNKYNLPLYKRLVAFVMSYSFTENQDSPSMVPMADMLNHASSNNAHLTYEQDHLKMVALEKIEPGQEIFNTFGKLGNSELLQMYGYVETEGINPYDAIDVPVIAFTDYIESSGKLTSVHVTAMLTFMRKWDMAFSTDSFMFDKRGFRYGPDFLQFLRMIHMRPEEFEELLRSHANIYNDPTCQKLLRQIKLAKKTDTSSGVAVIDIDDSDDENESESANTGDKRKNNESELPGDLAKRRKIESGLPFPNLAAGASLPLHGVPVIQQQGAFPQPGLQHPSLSMAAMISSGHPFAAALGQASPFVNNTSSKGLTQSSAIMIDDDSDNEASNDIDSVEKSLNGDKPTSADENSLDALPADKSDDISEPSGNPDSAVNGDILGDDSSEKDKGDNAKSENDPNTIDASKTSSEKTESIDESDKTEVNSSESKETSTEASATDPSDVKSNSDDTETKADDAQEKLDSVKASSEQTDKIPSKDIENSIESSNKSSDKIVIEENGEDDEGEEDVDDQEDGECDEDDDLEFVGEDIRCQLPYDKLNQAMPSTWKETVRCVLRRQLETMKADEADCDMDTLTNNQKMSRIVRQGQREIINTFIASLT